MTRKRFSEYPVEFFGASPVAIYRLSSFFVKSVFLFSVIAKSMAGTLYKTEYIEPLEPAHNENPAKVELGERLFHDARLSKDNTVSCASCHNVLEGGDDGRQFSVGIDGRIGSINAPTVYNLGSNVGYFWDGRAESLDDQISGPIHNPTEMASNWIEIVEKLKRDNSISVAFQNIYPEGLTAKNIRDAIVAYELALVTVNSPVDQYLRGDLDAISDEALRGFKLFNSMGCSSCHQGKNLGGNMYQVFGITGDYFADRGNVTKSDFGRFNITGKETDRYKFKVPTLRNVAETAPYFHDGSTTTLEEAIVVMARYQLGRPIDDTQVNQIRSFLESLTGEIQVTQR